MDCPNCAAHFSDLRDICPKCYLDLRPHKLHLGLTATYPGASYEELLKKLGVTRPAPSSYTEEATHPAASQSAMLGELAASIPNFEGVYAIFDTENSKRVERVPTDRLDYPFNTSNLTESQPDLHSAPPTDSPIFVADSTPITPLTRPSEGNGHNPSALSHLFLEAWNEITLNQNDVTTELHFEQLREVKNTEQTKLLFDMSYEAIIDPDSEKGYAADIQKSESRHVKAEALEQQLHGIERMINAPLLTLKALKARSEADRLKEITESPVSVVPATRRQIFWAGILDLFFYCFGAAFIAATYLTFTDSDLWFDLWNAEQINLLRVIAPVTLWVTLTIIALWTMPLISLLAWGKSLGQSSMGVQLLNKNGKKLRLSNIVVRSFCYPLFLACFGYLPVLWKKASLHDALAKTKPFAA